MGRKVFGLDGGEQRILHKFQITVVNHVNHGGYRDRVHQEPQSSEKYIYIYFEVLVKTR